MCMAISHGINASKAVKKSLPPQALWESVPYKYILGPYNLFEEAKNKEKDAEFVSSDDAKINALQNKENILPLKRKQKPKFYNSFSDIESTDADSIPGKKFKNIPTILKTSFDDKPIKHKKIVPNPPCNYNINKKDIDIRKKDKQLEQNRCSLSFSDINESQSFDYGDYFSQNEDSFQDNIQKNHQEEDVQTDKYSKKIKTPTNTTLVNMEEKRSIPVIKSIDYNPIHVKITKKEMRHESHHKGKSDSTLQIQENEKQKYIETDIITGKETSNKEENAQEGSLNLILNTVLAMNRKLDSILAFHDEQNPNLLTNCFFDLLPQFPLNSMEDFKKFSRDLNENEELRKQFQKKIRSIGGKSAENHLINSLVITLTNELAKHLT